LQDARRSALRGFRFSFRLWVCVGVFLLLQVPAAWTVAEIPETLRFHSVFQLPEKVELCGEPVPLEIPDVWERLDREFTISVYDQAQVFMWMRRMHRYFPYIEQELRAREMPDDIKYLAVAESSLIPHVQSYKGALGTWQFMPGTGKRYGLRSDSSFEDRLNFESSTRSALSYLQDLYREFGSWSLAMAAYNCGEGRVASAVREQGETCYYRLILPRETERYVFRILAAKIILRDPERYGYALLDPASRYAPPASESFKVTFEEGIHARTIAGACGAYYRVIKELNPEIKGHYFPAGTYVIRVPEGSGKQFVRFYEQYKKKWAVTAHREYVVQRGENLSRIAERFNVTVDAIKKWNKLSGDTIHPGQTLKIY